MSMIRNVFGRRPNFFDPSSFEVWDPFEGFPFRSHSELGSHSWFPPQTASFAQARIDWVETPTAHVFRTDVPGLRKEEVKVAVEEGRVLHISGERRRELEKTTDTWHRVERISGKFSRRFRLPENAKFDQVKAVMDNGVLTVTVPKEEPRRTTSRNIEISCG
ncbi:18.1 kDa class I heat shock protein [Ziziphus jujuba]|uniref:18.1 kDa class I heat shock protein n=2 Tax=Ziziphus jujuba TaxID=326968 RepID=A0A6P3ZGR9_ZIZJJ|nr:18.1 kDa class I heat shock protein [Ziziphus jujuba]KAH7537488.1 hypothetical protein FEM48_Zijuj03G0098300 [Ziziphus jujuba var. spinosa]